jgi:hypothetical protein
MNPRSKIFDVICENLSNKDMSQMDIIFRNLEKNKLVIVDKRCVSQNISDLIEFSPLNIEVKHDRIIIR